MSKKYDQCLEEMFSLHRFGIKLGLDVIRHILNNLQNPENTFSCIHIAGTNGKGSIASGLASILAASGYKVGLYTSPHLIKFNERITINGIEVSDEEIVASYQAVKSIPKTDREPTFFEYTTAMALHLFARTNVDWAIIETGMGGRLDATNVLSPALCVISNISMEHRFYLGNTIAEITGEKGGIIKHNTPVVTGVTQKSAIDVLQQIASDKSAPLYRLGEHFKVRRCKNGGFSYSGIDHQWKNMKTGLPGSHQVDNAALILAACEVLLQKGLCLELSRIKKSLETYSWPGRLEIIPASPEVIPEIIIDGAHNLMAARKLARFLKQEYTHKKITLVIGILDDKPYESIMQSLLPNFTRVILTEPDIDRSLSPEKLMPLTQSIVSDTIIVKDVTSAVTHAIETTPPDSAICIAGSLYVVGEAKQALKNIGI
ncbi:MAG: bifunctional folylpolyglutamate synthase/dihydrofolate synthase [Desulfobacteraceae bacterium]|nr:bifunctional folylpolyglutamate synthase/dihydrofolate synthase [Desulfobacteraceae bacterium]MBC2754552.1 bifunctional folylpolyglutamate synthase/dihydrofolate synthase [Desulfobacteraceae bacterium]MBC2763783.1 bifunctional folylpolyglutamate synthase/dihydrofolate synthase [ANME-2 cluster archaeon]